MFELLKRWFGYFGEDYFIIVEDTFKMQCSLTDLKTIIEDCSIVYEDIIKTLYCCFTKQRPDN